MADICPTCKLAPTPFDGFVRAAAVASRALARLGKARGELTQEQRFAFTLATTAVLGLETLFMEEAARQRGQE